MDDQLAISRRNALAAGLGVVGAACAGAPPALALPPRQAKLALGRVPFRGVDCSFIPQLESLGVVFFDNSVPRDALSILASRGMNTLRLRVWNNPTDGFCSVQQTLAMAQRAKALGMRLLIDFHYSDSWADPGQQNPPASWSGFSIAQLENAVSAFTASTLAALNAQGTPAAIVQIGNEITAGMLWPTGSNASSWTNFARLYRAGASAVRSSSPGTRVMLHIDRGGDNAGARWFFDNALANQMHFDIIGLSYYCWWHGTLAAMQSNLIDLATRYRRPIHIVETAYPWTLGYADTTNNFVWQSSQCLPQYAPTPTGQATYTAALIDALASVPDGLGQGVCWWAPEAVAATGLGSPWENLTLFDFARGIIPAAAALGASRPVTPA